MGPFQLCAVSHIPDYSWMLSERYFNNTASAPTFCHIFRPRLEKGWRSTADRPEWPQASNWAPRKVVSLLFRPKHPSTSIWTFSSSFLISGDLWLTKVGVFSLDSIYDMQTQSSQELHCGKPSPFWGPGTLLIIWVPFGSLICSRPTHHSKVHLWSPVSYPNWFSF